MFLKKTSGISAFLESSKTVIVRVVEWVIGGDQSGSLIISDLRYTNEQDALIPNMSSKIVWGVT